MTTSKIQLRTIEEQISDFKPAYAPIYPLFLASNAKQYAETVGEVNYTRMEVAGDVRAKRITPKDSEMHLIAVGPSKKGFKKYFSGAAFQVSTLQGTDGVEQVNGQVLDEHNKQFDELLAFGDGTADNNVVNNGLYWSGDPNHVTNSSYEVKKGTAGDYLVDLHNKIQSIVNGLDSVPGRKIVFTWGDVSMRMNSMYGTNGLLFKEVLQKSVGDSVSFVKLPSNMAAANTSGFIVVAMDQVSTSYTTAPKIDDQGVNAEKKHVWTNFLSGSIMLDVGMLGAITKQVVTWEA